MKRRLVLFDIDGTLLSSGPLARQVFAEALRATYGTSGDVDGFRFEGKLDPIIVTELMREAGVEVARIEALLPDALARYLDGLEGALARQRPSLKPRADELVARVATERSAVAALLTGNVERGARIKLVAAGLWHHFAFGAFGNEAPSRNDLGPVALRKALAAGHVFTGEQCVIVGDAPQDVACGKALGARVVAVATGRTSAEVLAALGADVVLPDFSDLAAAEAAILST